MTPSLLRSNVSSKPEFVMLEKTFGSLTHSMAYFCQMPMTILSALNHSQKVTRFPMEAAQRAQANVARWREATSTQRASAEHLS